MMLIFATGGSKAKTITTGFACGNEAMMKGRSLSRLSTTMPLLPIALSCVTNSCVLVSAWAYASPYATSKTKTIWEIILLMSLS